MSGVNLYKEEVLQNAATATGNGTPLGVLGYNTVVFNVIISATATVTFEGSVDGTNWDSLQASDITDGSAASTATATGLFRSVVSGLHYVRARISSYSSGIVTVHAIATVGTGSGGAGGGTGSSSNQVQGAAADNAAAVGNPVRIGAKYNSSTQTYADGDIADLQGDVNGNLKVREQYTPGYEDNTNNKAVVEHRYSPSALLTADGQVKASAGFIHTVTFSCDDAAPTAGTITIYDNTAESGTEIMSWTLTTAVFNPTTITLDCTCATGIYVGFTTTADVNVLVTYR